MAKIATYAAIAISLAAAIPTGGASLTATTLLSGALGTSVAVASAIAAGFSVAASIGAGLLAKKPSGGGTQTDWSADPNASIPILFGRTGVAGNITYRKGSGDADKNKYETINTVLSLGPVASIDTLYCDRKPVAFNGTTASGSPYFERLWMAKQRGLCPETGSLNTGVGNKPGWTPAHKMSGLAADQVTMLYDAKGKNTFTTEPQMLRVGHWVLCYDAREDSTYPGGSGPQRANDETTWQWSNNPYVVGVTWALGWHQNGKRRGGVGLRPDQIDIGSFVEASNIADLNGWTLGGQVTSRDDKWEVMKAILQAGGGEPIRDGAILSCIIQAPRVSIATIGAGDLIGKASVPRSRPRKERINGIIPKYRSEEHFWEQVSGTVARIDAYVAQDGGIRTQEIEYPLVQVENGADVSQATQLAGYDVELSRERMPITLPLKLRWIGYRSGDCITCAISELGLVDVQLIIIKRSLDPASGAVTLTVRTEDPDKHARVFALTGDLPPVATFDRPNLPSDYALEVPVRADIATSFPIGLTISAAAGGAVTISNHVRRYTDGHADVAVTGTNIASGLAADTYVAIGYDDPDRLGGAVTYLTFNNDIDARVSPDHPGRHYVGYVFIPETGSSGGGGATPPGGSGGCPVPSARVLLANAAQSGPGDTIRMGDLEPGMWVWSPHEHTGEWRAWRVSNTWRFISPIWAVNGRPDTSPSHLWSVDPLSPSAGWQRMDTMGRSIGRGDVIGVTVAEAHTYVLVADDGSWLLSHNKIAQQDDA